MIEYPTKVLLATDGTPDSEATAIVAIALASREGAELHVVHVGYAPFPTTGTTVGGGPLPGQPAGYAEQQARELLEEVVEWIQQAGGDVSGSHLRMGQPSQEVVSLSEVIAADLLVIGSGQSHSVRRAISDTTRRAALGRVSDYVVRSARCPVLVVHPDGVPRTTAP